MLGWIILAIIVLLWLGKKQRISPTSPLNNALRNRPRAPIGGTLPTAGDCFRSGCAIVTGVSEPVSVPAHNMLQHPSAFVPCTPGYIIPIVAQFPIHPKPPIVTKPIPPPPLVPKAPIIPVKAPVPTKSAPVPTPAPAPAPIVKSPIVYTAPTRIPGTICLGGGRIIGGKYLR